jgi:hypothetical protein
LDGLTNLEFKVTYENSLVDGPPYVAFSPGTVYNLLYVLDWLAVDMLVSMMNVTNMTSLHAGVVVDCPGVNQSDLFTQQDYEKCTNDPPELSITSGRAIYNNGSMLGIVNGLTPALNQSISNFLQAFLAAFQADMGIWQNNSFFVNADMIYLTISPADAVNTVIAANSDLRAYYEDISFMFPAAYNLQTLISGAILNEPGQQLYPLPASSQTPYSIATTYVCHTQRLKSTFSLIVCKYYKP